MPEIKRTFTAGKMNKDLDERLVRNGEYRDALNVQVRTTSGENGIGDAGVVQNIKGNSYKGVAHITKTYTLPNEDDVLLYTKFVGSVADEKNDKAYFFAASPLPEGGFDSITHTYIMGVYSGNPDFWNSGDGLRHWIDSIIELDATTETSTPIFVDKYGVTGRLHDVIGADNVTATSIGLELKVLDGSLYRIGMIAYFYNNDGEHLFVNSQGNGVKIIDIQENKLILESEQDLNLQTELTNGNIDYRSAFKFIYPERVLEFDYNSLIPNINIIDNLLFYTDGKNEPKKINIDRSKAGTIFSLIESYIDPDSQEDTIIEFPNIQTAESYLERPKHTKLFVNNTIIDADQELVEVKELEWDVKTSDIKREHITVIRKAPLSPPTLEISNTDREGSVSFPLSYSGFIQNGEPIFGETRVIQANILLNQDVRLNDVLRFTSDENNNNPVTIVTRVIGINGPNAIEVQLTFIDPDLISQEPSLWNVEVEQEKPLFETKFGRIGYRYQYEDNEYSTFSPWSELAFLPGGFSYTPSKGYNEGMSNNTRKLVIRDFIPDNSIRPIDVKKIDILWKTTDDQNVYVIKSITRGRDVEWDVLGQETKGELTMTSEMIHRVLSNEQLLRSWDNVPKTASTQEITGSRLVFGNYTQGYDINKVVNLEQSLLSDTVIPLEPKKSIKSIRNYKFGMVFGDRYGRETPVLARGYNIGVNSGVTGDTSIDKSLASFSNKFRVKQNWETEPEDWMEYVKYYVKETSNEYYNLVMDRWYIADDDNSTIWMSFPSVDRNKVDEETYLLLKNEHGSQNAVVDRARYKILAIESEAPDFIKTDYRKFEKVLIDPDNVFSDTDTTSGIPDKLIGSKTIRTDTGNWELADGGLTPEIQADQFKGTIKVRIVGEVADNPSVTLHTRWVTVARVKTGPGNDRGCDMKEEFTTEEANMYIRLGNIFTIDAAANVAVNYYMEFMDEVVENKPEFDGRFFVKIEKDPILTEYVASSTSGTQWQPEMSAKVGYITNKPENDAFILQTGMDGFPSGFNIANYTEDSIDNYYSAVQAVNLAGGNNDWGLTETGSGVVPSFIWDGGINGNSRTQDFWNWHNTQVSEGNAPKIFIDAIPAFRGWNKVESVSLGIGFGGVENDILVDLPSRFDSRNPYVAEHPDYEVDAPGNYDPGDPPRLPVSLWFNDQFYAGEDWINGFSYIGSNSYVYGGVPYGPGNNPEQQTKNYLPPGFSQGSGSSGTYNQFCFSVVGETSGFGTATSNEQEFKSRMQSVGQCFRFQEDADQTVYKIIANTQLVNPNAPENQAAIFNGEISIDSINYHTDNYPDDLVAKRHSIVVRFVRLDTFGGEMYDNGSPVGIDYSEFDPRGYVGSDGIGNFTIEFVTELNESELIEDSIRTDKACWETEPKKDMDIDIYYEASGAIPMNLKENNIQIYAQPSNSLLLEKAKLASTVDILSRKIGPDQTVEVNINSGLDYGFSSIFAYVCKTIGNRGIMIAHNNDNAFAANNLITFPSINDVNEIYTRNYPAIDDFITFTHPNGLITRSKIIDHLAVNSIAPFDKTNNISPSYRDTIDSGATFNVINDGQPRGYFFAQTPSPLQVGMELRGTFVKPGSFICFQVDFGSFGTLFAINQHFKEEVEGIAYNEESLVLTGIETTGFFEIDPEVWKYEVDLNWFNCYSFGNGVESDRIRDDFNAPTIDNGIKASSTFLDYKEETIGSGLIHSSELYNAISSVNGLNEFSMGQKITKNLNPIYGSIQALKTRDTNLVTFCEDKVLKVLANKDAVFNADGNPQLTATNRVLGQTIPFAGDYGISKNPESLAVDQYRMYFTDKQRGAVLRLSGDGLTPISNVGMKTYFRENLRDCSSIVGTFDAENGEYNATLNFNEESQKNSTTVSFNEGGKAWVSFKSFLPNCGVSVSGKYFTTPTIEQSLNAQNYIAASSKIWMHNANENRNNFYTIGFDSTIDVVFNDMPSIVKSFKAVNYEGTQGRVLQNLFDEEYYNLESKDGWYVNRFDTDTQSGRVNEFLEKEGKWFNFITGGATDGTSGDITDYINPSEFSVQGIGFPLLIGEGFAQSQATLEIENESPTINPETNEADEDTFQFGIVQNMTNYQIPQDNGNTVPMFSWSQVSMPGSVSPTIGNFPELVEIYGAVVTRAYVTYKVQFNYNGSAAFIDENNDEYLEVAIIKNGVALPIITQGVGDNATQEYQDVQGFSFGPEIRAYKIDSNTYEYELLSARNSNMFSNQSGVGNFSTTIFIGDIYQLQFSDDDNNVGTKTITLTGDYVNPDPADVPLVDWKPLPSGDGQVTAEGTIGSGDNDINDSYTGPLGVQVNLGLAFGPNQDQEATDQEPTDILD